MQKQFYYLKCIDCGSEYSPTEVIYICRECGGLLSILYERQLSPEKLRKMRDRPLSVWRYKEMLPVEDTSRIVTLGEGGTTLNKCSNLCRMIGKREIYVKNEGENPTGSFKDRGMTVGITKALELGMNKVACASTGNTSASLAAYAARAGLECAVLIPSGKVAFGKLTQALIHGARVIQILGNFDDALKITQQICLKYPIYLLNSLNPYRLEGQKTIAFEITDQMRPQIPEKIVVPIGNAGNISAIWKGFRELYEQGLVKDLPQMIGIQAEGAAPIANSFRARNEEVTFVRSPETVATAIRIGSPVNWKKAVQAVKESKGFVETVSDEQILEAQRLLAILEGIFVEPASAASIAGLKKLVYEGRVEAEEKVVCIATGHGLKDPEVVSRQFPHIIEANADMEEVVKMLISIPKSPLQVIS